MYLVNRLFVFCYAVGLIFENNRQYSERRYYAVSAVILLSMYIFMLFFSFALLFPEFLGWVFDGSELVPVALMLFLIFSLWSYYVRSSKYIALTASLRNSKISFNKLEREFRFGMVGILIVSVIYVLKIFDW